MKNKRLHIILTIFSLSVFFTIALIFTGCYLDQQLWDAREETERKAAEQEVKEAQKEQIRALEEDEKSIGEDESVATEEAEDKRSFPDEPVTYYFEINECPITVTVDFKTAQITGLAKNPPFDDVIFTDGKIDLDNLEINTSASQVIDEDSKTTVLTITGKISDDFNTLNGVISNREGASEEFTATR